MREHSRRMALCGILCALAAAALLLGGMVPMATFGAPLLAMVALLPVLEEYGARTAATAYGAVALLALLLAADREMALVYLFFGWYPLLRPRIAGLRSRLIRVLCRLAVCNALIAVLYGLLLSLLGVGDAMEGMGDLSLLLKGYLLVCGNVTFLILDLALDRLTTLWRRKLRRRLLGAGS